jgi:hypothetical protein
MSVKSRLLDDAISLSQFQPVAALARSGTPMAQGVVAGVPGGLLGNNAEADGVMVYGRTRQGTEIRKSEISYGHPLESILCINI